MEWYMRKDGWIVGSSELVIWIPNVIRHTSLLLITVQQLNCPYNIQLDFSKHFQEPFTLEFDFVLFHESYEPPASLFLCRHVLVHTPFIPLWYLTVNGISW